MPDYKEMYYLLFNAVTDAIEALERTNYCFARNILSKAQRKTEELYLKDCDAVGAAQ